jgi:hypothetical protein
MSIRPVILSLIAGTLLGLASQGFAQTAVVAASRDVSASKASLPIRSIALYRSGVASFQRRGAVEGSGSVLLRFDASQVNDILKSMVVLDLSGQGRIDGVRYASQDPLAKRLASFGVDLSGNPSIQMLLNAMRGAKVRLATADGVFTGTVVGTEQRLQANRDAAPTPVAFVNLLTDAGLKSLSIAQAREVEVLDKDLASELSRALAAIAEHRADHTKSVQVDYSGAGSRELLVGYVQEAPVWKASYRLVIADDAAKASAKPQAANDAAIGVAKDFCTMQGWAIVENTTDEDWSEVQLSLVSGQPVSFQMDLYQPLYATRPLVPVPVVAGVAPRIFEGAIAGRSKQDAGPGGEYGRPAAPGRKAEPKAGAPEMVPGSPASGMPVVGESSVGFDPTLAVDSVIEDAQASAVETGEVFEYRLDHPVTIERQRSAMLPIIGAKVSGRRVSICATGSRPLRGLELVNDSGLELLPGPLAVYDQGVYAGDAQVGFVPPGDKRLIAYAADLQLERLIDSRNEQRVRSVKIVQGVGVMTTELVGFTKYHFTNKDAARARAVIVEHAKDGSWQLRQPATAIETTQTHYRFEVDVAPGASKDLEVVEARTEESRLELISTDPQWLLSLKTSGASISDKTMQAFRKAASLAADVKAIERRIAELAHEQLGIGSDQDRLRQNMNAIDRTSALYASYMKKLTDQETRVDAIGVEARAAQAALQKAQQTLTGYLADLNVE